MRQKVKKSVSILPEREERIILEILNFTTMKKIFLREAGRQQEARSHFVGVLKTDFLSEAFVSKRKIIALSSTFLWILSPHQQLSVYA